MNHTLWLQQMVTPLEAQQQHQMMDTLGTYVLVSLILGVLVMLIGVYLERLLARREGEAERRGYALGYQAAQHATEEDQEDEE
jgi:hypothetical protein